MLILDFGSLGALITCLKHARSCGILLDMLDPMESSDPIWIQIRLAIDSSDEQVLVWLS